VRFDQESIIVLKLLIWRHSKVNNFPTNHQLMTRRSLRWSSRWVQLIRCMFRLVTKPSSGCVWES